MHTVRNRIASRPPITTSGLADFKPPIHRSSREELARLLRTGAPSVASAPTPAVAVPALPLTAAAWPASALAEGGCIAGSMAVPAESRPQKRRNPKGKKARKAAARKAAGGAAISSRKAKAPNGKAVGTKHRVPALQTTAPQSAALPPAPPVSASPAISLAAPAVHPNDLPQPTMPVVESEALLALCLQAEPALALMLPSRPEPQVEAQEPEPEPVTAAVAPAEPAPAHDPARMPTQPETPGLLVAVPETEPGTEARIEPLAQTGVDPGSASVLTLPARPEPLVEAPAALAEAEPALGAEQTPSPSALALATLADAQTAPLPRSRSLVPARRQGLVDVIAFLLRDSGRRLARWSARRAKSKAERDLLRRAEARQRALLSELEALDALRRHRG